MYVCREKRNSNNCKKGRENRQHIRHGGKLLQVTVCVVWFVASHVPPNIASEVTWNVCINVPAPQLEEQLPLFHWPIQFTAANKQYMSRFRYGGGRKYGTQKNGIIVGTEMDSVSQKKSPTKYSNKQQPHISMFSCQHEKSMLPFGEEDWELYINATEFDKTAPSGSFVTGYVHCKTALDHFNRQADNQLRKQCRYEEQEMPTSLAVGPCLFQLKIAYSG